MKVRTVNETVLDHVRGDYQPEHVLLMKYLLTKYILVFRLTERLPDRLANAH